MTTTSRQHAGNAFGEEFDATLNPNLAGPANTPAGSTVTLHWLQILNESQQFGNPAFGYPIAGQSGFWQLDNGDKPGGGAAGWQTGPYYDSNAGDPNNFSVPPTFHDFPNYYSGVGTYLHFDVIPTWDVYTPASGDTPASEQIDVANYGLAWGFQIVPETPSIAAWSGLIVIGLVWSNWRRWNRLSSLIHLARQQIGRDRSEP